MRIGRAEKQPRSTQRPQIILFSALSALSAVAFSALSASPALSAPAASSGQAPATPPNPRAAAPFDLTGYWVSVVSEDWAWRMVTPRKGDYASVPLNAEGRRVADTWDPATDEAGGNQCRSYGVGHIMRVPGRVHVTWDNDTTIKIETDAGQQTRMLRFDASQPASGDADWQGRSIATWDVAGGRGGRGAPPPRAGSLKVVTTRMKPGYLRKNGVPYSEKAIVTEYFDRHSEPNGDQWFTVTTIVEDPTYLDEPFITSSHFKKEPDGAKWHPTACSAQ
jgi:hypothetical protein